MFREPFPVFAAHPSGAVLRVDGLRLLRSPVLLLCRSGLGRGLLGLGFERRGLGCLGFARVVVVLGLDRGELFKVGGLGRGEGFFLTTVTTAARDKLPQLFRELERVGAGRSRSDFASVRDAGDVDALVFSPLRRHALVVQAADKGSLPVVPHASRLAVRLVVTELDGFALVAGDEVGQVARAVKVQVLSRPDVLDVVVSLEPGGDTLSRSLRR